MKKIVFICLGCLLLAGCGNNVKCSLEKDEVDYKIKQEVTLSSDKDGNVTSAETILTMTFETEEAAQEYYSIFGELEEKSNLSLDGNKLIVKDSEKYSDKSDIKVVQEKLEESGYVCK